MMRPRKAATGRVMLDFNDLLLTFQSNMSPALRQVLADDLGVSADAVRRLGVGFYPANQCWIFPERDGDGKVVGLLKRTQNSRKSTWKGGKRGLSYESVGTRDGQVRSGGFVRVGEAGVPCPICGRENDGCLVSEEDPDDPAAVICVRTPEGAARALPSGAGYLHHRHPDTGDPGGPVPVLPLSSDPVVVTEGASDCLAAMSLGYVAVGKSNDTGHRGLIELLCGRNVILVGDRDSHGAGQHGLEGTFQSLKPACTSVLKVLPPEGFKDLRQWYKAGLTREQFEAHVKASGNTADDGSILPNTAPLTLIKSWLQREQTKDGAQLLQYVHNDYYTWEGPTYRKMDQTEIRGQWYNFFTDRPVRVKDREGGVKITTLTPDRKFMADLHDAASAYCNVRIDDGVHEPFLIKARAPMDLARAVIFRNGIYYIERDCIAPVTPDVFITSTLPYDYDPRHQCAKWLWVVQDWFGKDEECVALLQEWYGYNMIATNHMQSMMFFYGVPGSGKSTAANILRALLGNARCCGAVTDNFKSLFGKETLLNKYAAVMSETRETARADIDRLLQMWKAITGGDVMSVARKYKQAVDARLFCRLTYVANDVIPFDDTAGAMPSRTNLLYFPNDYRNNNPDRSLEQKLRAELPGIALWAIEGLKRLLKNDAFTRPKLSEMHLENMVGLTNPIEAMLQECCEYTGHRKDYANATEMYDLWKAWCDDTRTRTCLSSQAFTIKLGTHSPSLRKERVMEAGRTFQAYRGIRITMDAKEKYLKR